MYSRAISSPYTPLPPPGRSGESDSPIFLAESLESWDEGSGSDRGEPLRDERLSRLKEGEADSETSSINFAEVSASDVPSPPSAHCRYTRLYSWGVD